MKRKYDIKWLESVDSTNNEMIRTIDSLDNMSVIAASMQTSGRGQRGNTWSSGRDLNLTFSVLLKFGGDSLPCLHAMDQFVISQAATLSLTDLLGNYGIDAMIKWSNDIYAGDRKISGMLIENSLKGEFVNTSVIGIGLNVNQTDFPSDLPNPTSMKLESGETYDCGEVLEKFMGFFERYISIMKRPGGLEKLRLLYSGLMYRKDEVHEYRDVAAGETFKGKIRGISETGMLRIEDCDGKIRQYGFKEIAFII